MGRFVHDWIGKPHHLELRLWSDEQLEPKPLKQHGRWRAPDKPLHWKDAFWLITTKPIDVASVTTVGGLVQYMCNLGHAGHMTAQAAETCDTVRERAAERREKHKQLERAVIDAAMARSGALGATARMLNDAAIDEACEALEAFERGLAET